MFRDRNFTAGMLFVVIVGLTYYASMALQPPYLQELMNYPVVTAGLIMGPRGVGTMASMLIVGRMVGRVDTRILLGFGLGAHGVVVLPDDRLDAGRLAAINYRRQHGAGLRPRLSVRAAERGDVIDAADRAADRRRRPLQPVAQYRLQRRHFGGEYAADRATLRPITPTSRRT